MMAHDREGQAGTSKLTRAPLAQRPTRRHAVGLEYTIGPVTCVLSLRLGLSCGDLILAREPAEDLLSADPMPGEVDLGWPGVSLSGCKLAEGAVRPGCVVVLKVFGQHVMQVVLVDDQQSVEEF